MIPPSRALPPPEKADAVVANNPAWPKDPDVSRRKAEAALERNRNISDEREREQNRLRPDQLTPGGSPTHARARNRRRRPTSPYGSGDAVPPTELGAKSNFGADCSARIMTRSRQVHRRAAAHRADRAAARLPDAVAGSALRRSARPRPLRKPEDYAGHTRSMAKAADNRAGADPVPIRCASCAVRRRDLAWGVTNAKRCKVSKRVRSNALLALAAIAILAAALATPALAAEPAGAKVADFTLANGLELVVIPDHRAPVVTHMIWYKVGAADETPGKSGLAHFLEHLMFKGTAKNPTGLFSQVVARIGGQENAFTSNDYTGYFQRVPSEQAQDRDGIRGRPHDRPVAHRPGGAAGARRHPRGAQSADRRTIRARGSASRSMPRCSSIILTASR